MTLLERTNALRFGSESRLLERGDGDEATLLSFDFRAARPLWTELRLALVPWLPTSMRMVLTKRLCSPQTPLRTVKHKKLYIDQDIGCVEFYKLAPIKTYINKQSLKRWSWVPGVVSLAVSLRLLSCGKTRTHIYR